MKRKVVQTADGSTTIYFPEWEEHYHSKHGAIQEAIHVFINMGLSLFTSGKVSVLEIGFGTGLNAFITLLEAEKKGLTIAYDGVEAYPVPQKEIAQLNYPQQLQASESLFYLMHHVPWEKRNILTPFFTLHKRRQFFDDIKDKEAFDLIYFDAFGARVQPELWTVSIFKKMIMALRPKGVLVTYSAKGSVRRAMQQVGFDVTRLPGPPGKREMLRGVKPEH